MIFTDQEIAWFLVYWVFVMYACGISEYFIQYENRKREKHKRGKRRRK